ncbi:MAG: ArsR family transcriptional regulator [Chloroflexi bacterium]|jgi:predicted ArsR family transcriptional regulator|nr:ArsR family transcriptional regulator [Chloroflexota bacterium]MBT4074849.1 ArsR family transcriptional regulator [Chloroflexota bacterium]MBT6681014.1 ArsR family transcriptional regulator [Chloroflexota bacterium]
MASRSTRDTILELIQNRESETVAGLAEELSLAPATVRRHLDILQRDGMVTFSEIRRGTGRPEFLFSLTERGHENLPKHYSDMLGSLVSKMAALEPGTLDGKSGAEILDNMLTDMAHESVAERGDDGAGITRLTEILQEQDFNPEINNDQGKISLSLMSCPFRSVAMNNPQLCSYDMAVISAVASAPVERISCLTEGDPVCKYLIGDGSAQGTASD